MTMTVENFRKAEELITEIQRLNDFLNSNLEEIQIEGRCHSASGSYTKYISPSEQVSDVILTVLKNRLSTLEEEFKQL